jgi:predicted TIM-barrel fold metal-dependent hydrolase
MSMFDDDARAARQILADRRARGEDGPIEAPDWRRDLPPPSVKAPAGACDSHIHVLGPFETFALAPGSHQLRASTLTDWEAMQTALGLARALHVQSVMLGYSYQLTIHAGFLHPDRLRSIVMLYPEITDGELAVLEGAGVIGGRFGHGSPTGPDARRLLERIAERGWQAHFMYSSDDELDEWADAILDYPGRFVIEHMGATTPSHWPESRRYRHLLQAMDTGRGWVKLSSRCSELPEAPFVDLDPVVGALIDRYPSRLLWGSDWPHLNYFRTMPSDGELLEDLHRWVAGDADVYEQILVRNPSEAFDWPWPSPGSG